MSEETIKPEKKHFENIKICGSDMRRENGAEITHRCEQTGCNQGVTLQNAGYTTPQLFMLS